MSASRFLIENNGSNQDNIKLALSEAYHLCKEAGLKRITLVFPVKGNFGSSDIATFLGQQATKALSKGQSVDLGDGIHLELDIPKNISAYGNYEVVLAAYLTDKDMDTVDGIKNISNIVFLPWLEEDGKRWLSTWNPKIVGTSSWVVSHPSLPTPIQEEILRLGRCINMSTGLSHPSDKDMAKRTFSNLKKQGHTATEEAIRQFAVNNGWEPKRAQELASFAKKYMA
jgi:hypothetical protein